MIRSAWLGLFIVLFFSMSNVPAHAYWYWNGYRWYWYVPDTHDHGGDEYCWTWLNNKHVYVCGQAGDR